MTVLAMLQVAITLGQGIFGALNKAGLSEIASSVGAAVTALQQAHDQLVSKAELESFRTTPQW